MAIVKYKLETNVKKKHMGFVSLRGKSLEFPESESKQWLLIL